MKAYSNRHAATALSLLMLVLPATSLAQTGLGGGLLSDVVGVGTQIGGDLLGSLETLTANGLSDSGLASSFNKPLGDKDDLGLLGPRNDELELQGDFGGGLPMLNDLEPGPLAQ